MKKIQKLAKKFSSILNKVSWEEHIPGGKAKGKTPDDFDPKEVEKGQKVEMEHVVNHGDELSDEEAKKLSTEISLDHIQEFPNYYDGLEQMEKILKDLESK